MTGEVEQSDSTRPPSLDDLLLICRSLNKQHARYIIIGGLAIFEHALDRAFLRKWFADHGVEPPPTES